MIRHYWIKYLSSLVIVSLIMSSFVYILFMNNDFINSFMNQLSSKEDQTFIVYKALDSQYPHLEYDIVSNFPITIDELNEIKKVNNIDKITPKYIIPAYNYNFETGEYISKDFIIKSQNNEFVFDNTDSLYFETYDLKKESDNISYLSDNKEGLYIHSNLLEQLELTKDDLKDSQLSISLSIPISYQL